MKDLSHRNIAKLYCSFENEEKTKFYSVMEFCQRNLQQCINNRNKRPFPADQVLRWSSQILCGLKHLHSHQPYPIVHRDIKPEVDQIKQIPVNC